MDYKKIILIVVIILLGVFSYFKYDENKNLQVSHQSLIFEKDSILKINNTLKEEIDLLQQINDSLKLELAKKEAQIDTIYIKEDSVLKEVKKLEDSAVYVRIQEEIPDTLDKEYEFSSRQMRILYYGYRGDLVKKRILDILNNSISILKTEVHNSEEIIYKQKEIINNLEAINNKNDVVIVEQNDLIDKLKKQKKFILGGAGLAVILILL